MASRRAALAPLLAVSVLVAGCGSTGHKVSAAAKPGGASSSTSTSSTTAAAPNSAQAQIAVIRNWSDALRSGNVNGAAKYFARPSVFENGTPPVVIHTEQEAVIINSSLSCGAKLTAAHRRGRFIIATFTLTNRTGPGAGCGSGAGAPAAVDFVIAHGQIVDWIRAPANGALPKVPTPSTPQTPGEV